MEKTKENQAKNVKIKAEELLKEIAEVIRENFVAIYQEEENKLVMNIVNGQKFCIQIEEIE